MVNCGLFNVNFILEFAIKQNTTSGHHAFTDTELDMRILTQSQSKL